MWGGGGRFIALWNAWAQFQCICVIQLLCKLWCTQCWEYSYGYYKNKWVVGHEVALTSKNISFSTMNIILCRAANLFYDGIPYYISTIWILILAILFYFISINVQQLITLIVCVCLFVCMNKNVIQQQQQQQRRQQQPHSRLKKLPTF